MLTEYIHSIPVEPFYISQKLKDYALSIQNEDIVLDFRLDKGLITKGIIRKFQRNIQECRKERGLKKADSIKLFMEEDMEILLKTSPDEFYDVMKVAGVGEWEFADNECMQESFEYEWYGWGVDPTPKAYAFFDFDKIQI